MVQTDPVTVSGCSTSFLEEIWTDYFIDYIPQHSRCCTAFELFVLQIRLFRFFTYQFKWKLISSLIMEFLKKLTSSLAIGTNLVAYSRPCSGSLAIIRIYLNFLRKFLKIEFHDSQLSSTPASRDR